LTHLDACVFVAEEDIFEQNINSAVKLLDINIGYFLQHAASTCIAEKSVNLAKAVDRGFNKIGDIFFLGDIRSDKQGVVAQPLLDSSALFLTPGCQHHRSAIGDK